VISLSWILEWRRGINQHFPGEGCEGAWREKFVAVLACPQEESRDVMYAGLGETAYREDCRVQVDGDEPAE
jgi:hypothetical protein